MEDRRMMRLAFGKGDTRRVLVEAGTTVLVLQGSASVRGPLQWLAETPVAPEQRLGVEQALTLEGGGWIDLMATEAAELLMLPPQGLQVWQRVVRRLERLVGNEGRKKPVVLR
jgi:hypothetical protein